MKVRLLKRLRKESWGKYEIRDLSNVAGCFEKPWHIGIGINATLLNHEYTTREEAVEAAKKLWHDEAEKYLWENRKRRKRNKYPW